MQDDDLQPCAVATKRKATSGGDRAMDRLDDELGKAGDRKDLALRIERVRAALDAFGLEARDRELVEIGRGAKKNFAQRFSNALALKVAHALRPTFRGILPDENGKGQESLSASAAGLKRLDVNYSTPQIGLGLAVSIKTINFKDDATGRYTKNVRRVDGELRAEAQDCHVRQPFAVLTAILFMPLDAANDGATSSMKHAANVLAARSGRKSREDDASKFELAFLGAYDDDGSVQFHEANSAFPERGLPRGGVAFTKLMEQVAVAFRTRNAK